MGYKESQLDKDNFKWFNKKTGRGQARSSREVLKLEKGSFNPNVGSRDPAADSSRLKPLPSSLQEFPSKRIKGQAKFSHLPILPISFNSVKYASGGQEPFYKKVPGSPKIFGDKGTGEIFAQRF
jgi:hypothetical protein